MKLYNSTSAFVKWKLLKMLSFYLQSLLTILISVSFRAPFSSERWTPSWSAWRRASWSARTPPPPTSSTACCRQSRIRHRAAGPPRASQAARQASRRQPSPAWPSSWPLPTGPASRCREVVLLSSDFVYGLWRPGPGLKDKTRKTTTTTTKPGNRPIDVYVETRRVTTFEQRCRLTDLLNFRVSLSVYRCAWRLAVYGCRSYVIAIHI